MVSEPCSREVAVLWLNRYALHRRCSEHFLSRSERRSVRWAKFVWCIYITCFHSKFAAGHVATVIQLWYRFTIYIFRIGLVFVVRDIITASYLCFGLVYGGQRSLEGNATVGKEEEISSAVFPTTHGRIFLPWRQFRLAYVYVSCIKWHCKRIKSNWFYSVGSVLTGDVEDRFKIDQNLIMEGTRGTFNTWFDVVCNWREISACSNEWLVAEAMHWTLKSGPLFDFRIAIWIERFSAC